MAQIQATRKEEGEVFNLCGKENEEEMHEQKHPLLVSHDKSHIEPMENPKYSSESEDEENKKSTQLNVKKRK